MSLYFHANHNPKSFLITDRFQKKACLLSSSLVLHDLTKTSFGVDYRLNDSSIEKPFKSLIENWISNEKRSITQLQWNFSELEIIFDRFGARTSEKKERYTHSAHPTCQERIEHFVAIVLVS